MSNLTWIYNNRICDLKIEDLSILILRIKMISATILRESERKNMVTLALVFKRNFPKTFSSLAPPFPAAHHPHHSRVHLRAIEAQPCSQPPVIYVPTVPVLADKETLPGVARAVTVFHPPYFPMSNSPCGPAQLPGLATAKGRDRNDGKFLEVPKHLRIFLTPMWHLEKHPPPDPVCNFLPFSTWPK